MTARRTDMDRLQELVRLHRMKTGSREVARLLMMSPNTERSYRRALEIESLLHGPADELPSLQQLREAVQRHVPAPSLPPQQRSKLEAWSDAVSALVTKGVRPRAIFERLRMEHAEFNGTYPQVKRLCRALARSHGPSADQIAIPVQTLAGEIAQVDFGHVGKLFDPETVTLREAWCFVMVLGFSRKLVVRIVFDQRTETWLQLHAEAFAELGGVPETIVPDNLKAAVIRAAFLVSGPPSELNRSYRELARHYGFKVDPTPPYSPEKKGKVEAAVKYVKRSFFVGREKSDVTETRIALARWVNEVADLRVHGATHCVPQELFESEERSALLPLPARPFDPVVWKQVKVHPDTHVVFERRLYSAPWRLTGASLWLRATASTVEIYDADNTRVATHQRRGPGLRSTIEEHLPEYRRDLRHRSRDYWEARAARMGDDVLAYIIEVFDADDVLSQLRAVQMIVTHLETHPVERARAACRRASFFGSHQYGALKDILRKALDFEPLPTPVAPSTWGNAKPSFARNVDELLAGFEALDEPH